MKGDRDQALRARLKAAYASMAAEREARALPGWKLGERLDIRERFGTAGVRSLLDLGSGPGVDAAFFREQGLDVICIDLSGEMVASCRAKGLEAYEMDLADLHFPDASFDAVYALNSLLHVPRVEFESVLREIRRVLVPGGLFYLGIYGGIDSEGVWEDDDYRPKRFFSFRTDAALRHTVKAVFDVDRFRTIDVETSDPELHFQSMVLRRSIVEDEAAEKRRSA